MHRLTIALSFALLACGPSAFAARPFVTDDARVVDPGGYQIESFVKDQRRSKETEYWFLPAHNPGTHFADGRMELTLGGNVIRADSGDANLVVGQVKTLLRPLQTNGVGFAVTVGVNRVNPAAADTSFSPFVNFIASVSTLDDALVLHANLGVTKDRVDGTTPKNWGLGAEIRVTERIYGIAETYGISHDKPAQQAGIRYWVIPNHWQVDGTYGWQDAQRWISIGVRLLW